MNYVAIWVKMKVFDDKIVPFISNMMITNITITRRPHKLILARAHVMEQQERNFTGHPPPFSALPRTHNCCILEIVSQVWPWVRSLICVSLIWQSRPLCYISNYLYPSLEQWHSLHFTWFYLHFELDTFFLFFLIAHLF